MVCLPRLYNKRLKNATIILFVLTLILYSTNQYTLSNADSHQNLLQYESIIQHKNAHFNPRDTSLKLYQHINSNQRDQGLSFHWDDWVDLSPANKILDPYRELFPHGECDSKLMNFANVNAYWMETYSKKVLRGMVDLYCLKEIPSKIYAPTEHSYVEVPVSPLKKRIGYNTLQLNTTKNELLTEMQEFDPMNSHYNLINYKHLQPRLDLTIDDFKFNPDDEITRLLNLNKTTYLNSKDENYLSMLTYANEYVDHADKYFKYPWIIDDVISGHSHHFAYPFFKQYTSDRERQSVIHHMIRAWFSFSELNHIPSWVNYGSLLGWAYNGVNMPWDTDIDIQLPIQLMDKLGRDFNKSLILEDPRYGNSKYWLVISPTYIRQGNGKNFIDARFIDINSGLYIDLSALSHTNFTPPQSFYDDYNNDQQQQQLVPVNCKNFNFHALDELLPIRHTYFEGTSVYIPHNVTRILKRKYGAQSFTTKLHFHNHNYQQDIQLWVPDEICSHPPLLDTRFINNHLSLEGACNNHILQDEYKITHEAATRHSMLNQNLDQNSYYDISKLKDLPLTRKDVWDYYNDILSGLVNHDNWYHRQEMARI